MRLIRRSTLAASLACLAGLAHADVTVGMLVIDGPMPEQESPLAWLMAEEAGHTLTATIQAIDRLAHSDHQGLVIRLKDAELSTTAVQELGAAVKRVRAAGKKVHVFAEAYGNTELALAAYADESIVQAGGVVSISGLYTEEMFLADTLKWVGLKAQMVQVGDYKGAAEQMTNSKPSPAWEANINQLLDSIYGNFRSTLTTGLGISDAQLDKAMSEGWMTDPQSAIKAGLIDTALDLPDLLDHLDKAYGDEVRLDEDLFAKSGPKIDMSNPFALFTQLSKKPDTTPKKPTIAILHIEGPIVDGDSQAGGGIMGGEGTTGSRTIRRTIEEIIDEPQIKGVVVRINSPGGSAVASEIIWQGLRKLATKKPVWTSVGSMAASGGYYIAVGSDRIYVNPSSIVGSIGVVGGRLDMTGLYEWAKVNVVPRSRGPMADLFRTRGEWTSDELAFIRRKMTETYDLFTSRVTAGRPGIDLSITAEGRLFTGDKAVGNKMADRVGSIHDAIHDLAQTLDLGESFGVMHYPGPKSFLEFLEDAFGGFVQAPSLSAAVPAPKSELLGLARALVGERAWPQISDAIQGVLQLRNEPVILMTPRVLIFK